MEITFRTAAAKDAIKKVAEEVPEMLVGAGTVIGAGQVEDAVEAGAKFIVSPGLSEEVVKKCQELERKLIRNCKKCFRGTSGENLCDQQSAGWN